MPHLVMEAVPNFSEGRDRTVVEALAGAAQAEGADVLDWSLDPDHHRSVVTLVGTPDVIERAALAMATVARTRIDLRQHRGVHPRIGAMDVLPIVPVAGATMEDARALARQIGSALAEQVGIPVFFYGAASEPPGRGLAELRHGGFETLVAGWPVDRQPDVLPRGWNHPGAHPTAGATCVGARNVLLAWNVVVEGVTIEQAKAVARAIRERDGGFKGVRALALPLARRGEIQISMNMEELDAVSPLDVFHRLEMELGAMNGRIKRTEVIGMIPDQLLLAAAADRLRLVEPELRRVLSRRLVDHLALAGRGSDGTTA